MLGWIIAVGFVGQFTVSMESVDGARAPGADFAFSMQAAPLDADGLTPEARARVDARIAEVIRLSAARDEARAAAQAPPVGVAFTSAQAPAPVYHRAPAVQWAYPDAYGAARAPSVQWVYPRARAPGGPYRGVVCGPQGCY